MPTKKPTSPQKKISKKITTLQDVMTSESSLISGLAYVTVIGWLIAYFSSSQSLTDFDRFHIRQAFGLHMTMLFFEILGTFSMMPYMLIRLFWVVYVITMIIMMIQGWSGKKTKFAFLGDKFQQWFLFL